MSWKKFEGSVVGVTVEGDRTAPPTERFGNALLQAIYHRWLILFRWSKVAVLKVDGDAVVKAGGHASLKAPLHYGFRNVWGGAEVNDAPLTDTTFLVRVGREDCTCFVVDGNGKELPLRLVTVTAKNDPLFKKFPLI